MTSKPMTLDDAVKTIDDAHARFAAATPQANAAAAADPVGDFCRLWAVVRPVLVALTAIGGAVGILFPPLLKAAPVLTALIAAGDAVCANRTG